MKRLTSWLVAGPTMFLLVALGCAHDVVLGEYAEQGSSGGTASGAPTPVDDSDDNVPSAGSEDDHAEDNEHDDDDALPGSGGTSRP